MPRVGAALLRQGTHHSLLIALVVISQGLLPLSGAVHAHADEPTPLGWERESTSRVLHSHGAGLPHQHPGERERQHLDHPEDQRAPSMVSPSEPRAARASDSPGAFERVWVPVATLQGSPTGTGLSGLTMFIQYSPPTTGKRAPGEFLSGEVQPCPEPRTAEPPPGSLPRPPTDGRDTPCAAGTATLRGPPLPV